VPQLDPRKLQTFRVVAHAGRISTAAKLLHLSQPAVTTQIKMLEDECGRPLLTRSARGVVPNEWGRRVLDAAEKLHGVLEEARAALGEEASASGELLLAASMTTSEYVIPQLLAGFRALCPAARFRVDVANTTQVVEWVAEGRVPLGTVEGLARAPRVHLEHYIDDELVAVAATHARELHRVTCAAELCGVPLILREPGSGSRAVVDRALRRALGRRRDDARDVQLGSNLTVKNAAVAGLGIAFLSRWSIQLEVAAGRLTVLPLADLQITRSFAWALPSQEVPGIAGQFLRWARRNPPVPG
jgi:DNA-binding transcriptional LysR family regulator